MDLNQGISLGEAAAMVALSPRWVQRAAASGEIRKIGRDRYELASVVRAACARVAEPQASASKVALIEARIARETAALERARTQTIPLKYVAALADALEVEFLTAIRGMGDALKRAVPHCDDIDETLAALAEGLEHRFATIRDECGVPRKAGAA